MRCTRLSHNETYYSQIYLDSCLALYRNDLNIYNSSPSIPNPRLLPTSTLVDLLMWQPFDGLQVLLLQRRVQQP